MEFRCFKDWLEELKKISKIYPVLVEGKRDVEALKRLGVTNTIDLSGKRYADIVDILEKKAQGAVILYDLDPHGERISKKISELLRSQGFKVFLDFRDYLKEKGIIHIEDLYRLSYGKDRNS